MKSLRLILPLLAAVLTVIRADAQAPAGPVERGVGPMTLVTPRGRSTVRLLRREKDFVWVDQLTSSGKYVETGVARADVTNVEIPRPRVLDVWDQAATTDQVAQAQALLKRIYDTMKNFRDLPGIPVDEAQYIQGCLLEKAGRLREALALYDDVKGQAHKPKEVPGATLRAGICRAKLGEFDEALKSLEGATAPEEDTALLSDLHFERAKAYAAIKKHDRAIMDFLYLVVFHPYTESNEVRCLEAVIPSYIAIGDWSGAAKSMAALKSHYPDSESTRRAEALLADHQKELSEEADYVLKEESKE